MSSVTDYNIANASGASVRSDLNNVLLAVATNNSDTAEPATTYAFMLWIDTTNNLVKMRNGANDAWLTMPFAMNASNSVDINAGTIDGTTIGSSSASTGSFTSLSTTGDLTLTGASYNAVWDASDNALEFGANAKATFGASDDLQIYHNGSHSYIKDAGTGNLKILASRVDILDEGNSEIMATFVSDGAVTLYYDDSAKLATTSTGIDISGTASMDGLTVDGTATFTTADNTDTLSLISTDADANSGPNLRLYRNSSSPADSDLFGQIDFEGRNDNSQDFIGVQIVTATGDVSDGTEDAEIRFDVMTTGTLREYLRLASGSAPSVIINQDSQDINFQVKSDGNANMLFVDGGNDRVGIGTGTPGAPFQVAATPSDTVGTVGISLKDVDNAIEFGLRLDATSKDLHIDRYYAGSWYNNMTFDRSSGKVSVPYGISSGEGGSDGLNTGIKMSSYTHALDATDISNGYCDITTDITREAYLGIAPSIYDATANVAKMGYRSDDGFVTYADGYHNLVRVGLGGSAAASDTIKCVIFYQ